MKIGIMQPYFFPYIGYFQLLSVVDKWVVFDDTQFINKGWVNRNRILHPDKNKEWQYLTVPLKNKSRFDKICDIEINYSQNWVTKLYGKLQFYKKNAPFYKETLSFIENCLSVDHERISCLNIDILRKISTLFSINTEIFVQSDMDLDLGSVDNSGQWALRISEKFGATEYINPYGGEDIFQQSDYEKVGIKLSFLKPVLNSYHQIGYPFIQGLSIIDLMMWNSLESIKNMIASDYVIYQKIDNNYD